MSFPFPDIPEFWVDAIGAFGAFVIVIVTLLCWDRLNGRLVEIVKTLLDEHNER